jgi:hypothetical protein
MTKTEIIPCTKEEIDKLIEVTIGHDFYYMFYMVAKTTGRRIGELYGTPKKIKIGEKIVGKKTISIDGKEIAIDKKRIIYKRDSGKYIGGVQVKDIDFNTGMMKVWVLKRRKMVQDETILTKEALQIIRHYVVKKKLKENDYLFREKSYTSIQASVKRFSKLAGIEHKVSIHNFRHYFVTYLKKKGWTNDKISKLTGHKSPNNISIYDHVVASDIKEDALEDLRDI